MPATDGVQREVHHHVRQRLYINIDHVATLRQARRGNEPDPVAAAIVCERSGADGITAHLREDRRHIQDADIRQLAASVTTVLNLELACTDDMLAIAETIRPYQATLVPERRQEITTEGGLDLSRNPEKLAAGLKRLSAAGIRTSLFVDPVPQAMDMSRDLGATAVELHTGQYANSPDNPAMLQALQVASSRAAKHGLAVHAGHGLTWRNVGPIAAIPEIEELNIGHSVVSRAIFVGLPDAVRELRLAMDAARGSP